MNRLASSLILGFMIAVLSGCSSASPTVDESESGDMSRIESLLASGADINAVDAYGATALYWASYYGRTADVRELLLAGADPNIKTHLNSSALEVAVCSTPRPQRGARAKTEIVRMLLDHGADVNVQSDGYGSSPLMLAAVQGQTETVAALLEKGADTSLTNHAGQTALITAAREGYIEIVQALLAAGADVNEKTPAGFSVLYGAAMNGHENIVRVLVEKGADPNTKADVGTTNFPATPLKAAQKKGHRAVVEILKAAGARE
jgi:ankyrin repeat protein